MGTWNHQKIKELSHLARDLNHVTPLPGLIRAAAALVFVAGFGWGFFTAPTTLEKIGWAIPFGFAYASLLILTHDALHHTLTGWKWFDELFPRFCSYFALWPHGLYKELHFLHHRMNGRDARDPERVQWTEAEYENASAFKKWTYRNALWIKCFVTTGFGYLAHHFYQGAVLAPTHPRIKRALIRESIALLAFNGVVMTAAYFYGFLGEYLVGWFCLTYVAGGVLQFRAHVEHYGLWHQADNPLVGQILNSRNITTAPPVSWFFNHLNFHSAHHAYPRVPFYHLPEVHRRLERAFADSPTPLPKSRGYQATGLALNRQVRLIPKSAC